MVVLKRDGFNAPPDYYVFIDANDGNKIKARNGRTGSIDSVHATDAAVVINYCINAIAPSVGVGSYNTAYTGNGGHIYVGSGTFPIRSPIVIKSLIELQGAGHHATTFLAANDIVVGQMILSSMWSTLIGSTGATALGGDREVILRDFELDGNKPGSGYYYPDNTIGVGNGAQYGILRYGFGWRMQNLMIHGMTVDGINSVWSNTASPVARNYLFCEDATNLMIWNCNRAGIYWTGPNNSFMRGLFIWECGEVGIIAQSDGVASPPRDGSLMVSDSHIFFNGFNHYAGLNALTGHAPNAAAGGCNVKCLSYMHLTDVILETGQFTDLIVGDTVNSPNSPGFVFATGLDTYNSADASIILNTGGSNIVGWTIWSSANPGIRILSNANKIDADFCNILGSGYCLEMGSASTAVSDNFITAKFQNSKNGINWLNTGNINNTIIGHGNFVSGQTALTGSPNIDSNVIFLSSFGAGSLWPFGRPMITDQSHTTTAPAAGGAGALPATPKGYYEMYVVGVGWAKFPYY